VPAEPLQVRPSSPRKAWLWRGLQLLATLAAFAYVLSLVDPAQLLAALRRVPTLRLLAVLALTAFSLGCGTLRWSLLFRAFGAPRPPAFPRLWRLYMVGHFYNTYLPGGVGGDVVRGLASRDAWGKERAATAGLATVLIERVLGLAALLTVISLVSLLHPLPILGHAWLPGVLGSCAVAGLLIGLRTAHWLAARVPGRLAGWLLRLPQAQRWLPLLAAGLLSLVTQLVPALSGQLLLSSLSDQARLLDALLFVPLATASAFLPISVSGAGVREVLFVKLYESVGVAASSALAVSLLMWFSLAALAALGGLHTLWRPLASDAER
jgi:glycosyltransferase 2 family protein